MNERSLTTFVNCLNKRIRNTHNSVRIFNIFNQIMDYENLGKIKNSLIKRILKDTDSITVYEQKSKLEFEASISLKKILLHILQTQDIKFTRNALLDLFPLDDLFKRLHSLNKKVYELKTEDKSQVKTGYDELCDTEQHVLINIYLSLYLNKNSDIDEIIKLIDFSHNEFKEGYEEKVQRLEDSGDNFEGIGLSELKLVVINLYQF